ncbi:MAG TPA: type II toxin-antitoxin system prevent-host-death family antitoxin [Tepidisphaeraceae bacterium]|jgi:prevent-host-death family protein|nr:type II toxin-antitoxin system prevent-host-death family antitoxin [Tepidisphaeraceae bacterium]
MRKIGSYELKTHLAQVLDDVEHGQSVIVTRHGKPIARILPSDRAQRQEASDAAEAIRNFPRSRLPEGVTIRGLIEEGRH